MYDHFKSSYWQLVCPECLSYDEFQSIRCRRLHDLSERHDGKSIQWYKDLCLQGDCSKNSDRPIEFEVSFIVMDTPTVFNLLLSRLWILSEGHPLQLAPKDKFILVNKLIPMIAKEDMPIPSSTMYHSSISADRLGFQVSFFWVCIKNYVMEGGFFPRTQTFRKPSWWLDNTSWRDYINRWRG